MKTYRIRTATGLMLSIQADGIRTEENRVLFYTGTELVAVVVDPEIVELVVPAT